MNNPNIVNWKKKKKRFQFCRLKGKITQTSSLSISLNLKEGKKQFTIQTNITIQSGPENNKHKWKSIVVVFQF